eukprot:7689742-Pyramimonas_sp.AAC.1
MASSRAFPVELSATLPVSPTAAWRRSRGLSAGRPELQALLFMWHQRDVCLNSRGQEGPSVSARQR